MPPTSDIGDATTRLSHPVSQAAEGRNVVIARTVELLKQKREERPAVSAGEIRAIRDEGRA